MALKIRLRQQGRTNRQTFRVVLTDIHNKRDGKYLEMLGWYNPIAAENNVMMNGERIAFWLNQGAQISERVVLLMAKAAPEVYKNYISKLQAKRTKAAAQRRAL